MRYHVSLRQFLFSPFEAGGIPVKEDRILSSRRTEIIFADESNETIEDDWRNPAVSRRKFGQKFFGRTIFFLKEEEQRQSRGWHEESEEQHEEQQEEEGGEALEESEEFRKSQAAQEPTPEQKENHFLENHAVYRPWCEICVKSRGLGTQHRRATQKEAQESAEGPRIFSDYFFMSTEEDSVPMLALKFSRSKRVAATALPSKGVTELGCKFFSNFIKMTGVRRFINFSDGENAIKSLKEEAAKRVPEVEAISRESPKGDHQKNGDIESGVRELKRQMRAVRMHLESRLGRALSEEDPLLMWIPTFAGDCIAFHRRGADGKTPWERETGRKWRRPCLEFGEKVMIKEAYERSAGPKRDWQARMIPVRYVGHHARTGAVMGLTSEGVKFGTGVSRLSESERWSQEGLNELRGLPWDLQPRVREARVERSGGEVCVPRLPSLPAGSPAPRSFYVKREDVKPEKYGYTAGCRSGEKLMRTGRSHVAHDPACRERVFKLMEKDESERVEAFRTRHEAEATKSAEVAEESVQPAQEEEGRVQEAERMRGTIRRREVEEDPGGSPTKRSSSRWTQEGHQRYRKREAEVPAEELDPRVSNKEGETETEGAHAAPQAEQLPLEGSSEATGPMTVEDALKEGPADIDSLVNYTRNGSNFFIELGEQKNEFVAEAAVHVKRCFKKEGVPVTQKEAVQIAALQVQLAGCHITRAREFNAISQSGFVLDLTKEEDLPTEGALENLEERVQCERPALLIGSPACAFGQLFGCERRGQSEEQAELRRMRGEENLRTCVHLYNKQRLEKRFFLHVHPASSFSWSDETLKALQSSGGVFTVAGPMSYWDLPSKVEKVRRARSCGIARARTMFLTNSRFVAEALEKSMSEQRSGSLHLLRHVGGAVQLASALLPGQVAGVLEAVKNELKEGGQLSDLDLKYGGPVPSQPHFDFQDQGLQEDYAKFWDNISGEELPPQLVKKARREEIEWVRSINLYDKVPRAEADSKNIQPLKIRWVDVNKGDRQNYNVRSRLVGKELKAKTKGSLLAHELFSAMPPWEMVKSLLSLLVSDGVSNEPLVLGVFDISRAHFMAPATRELFIELPDEDRHAGEENMIGRLNRSMYGFRDASHNWMEDWQHLLEDEGYSIGVANPALFWNEELQSRGAVHGDDFYVLGSIEAVDRMARALKSRYSVRESHRLGFEHGCTQHATVLNRVVFLGEQEGRRFVQIEPDKRHVEIILSSLGLDKSNAKGVTTPSVKPTDAEAERFQSGPKLSQAETALYRSCVMRASFVSQDRADLGEAVKCLAQGMSSPTRAHLQSLKRLGRYLLHRPSVALRFWQQEFSPTITCMVDSDHASDRVSRKSTTGMVLQLGNHTIKTTSNLQTSVGLNVSEAEYYALCHGAAHSLGLRSYFADLGLNMNIVIKSDSNSARSFASRRGLGKQRHVMCRYLWLQERVRCKHLVIAKIHTDDNCSDILTKSMSAGTLEKHMRAMGFLSVEASLFHKSTKV